MLKNKFVKYVGGILVTVALCTGCGQKDDGVNPDNNVSSEPQAGGELVVGIAGDPYNLSVWVSNDMNSSLVMNSVLPRLMDTDDKGNKVPYIVKNYEVSEDAKEFTVEIHPGLTWHDGNKFTSEDLAFTAEYVAKHKLGYGADMYAGVDKIEIIDETTIKYYLKSPQVNFLSQVGYWVAVMPKHIFENVEDPMNFEYNGVGYGPYKLKEFKKGEYYTLEKVENWPLANDGKGAYLDTITYRIYPDANSLILAVKNGEVHVTGSAIPVAAQKQLESSPEKFEVLKVPSLGYGYFSFNYKNELLQDKVVREAIATTIDRDALVTVAMQGGSIKMETPISPLFEDLVKSNITYPSFDIDKANQLLEDAGYKDTDGDGVRENGDNKKLEFELIYRNTTSNIDSIANIFKTNAEEAGIKINLKSVDPISYTDKVTKQRDFDINVIEWGVIDDVDTSLSTIYRSDSSLNFMGYSNEEIDNILDQSSQETSYEKRIELMDEFQRLFVDELPAINTWVRTNAYGASKDYSGWDVKPGLYGLLNCSEIVKVYKN